MEDMIPTPSYIYDSTSGYLFRAEDFYLIQFFRSNKSKYLEYLKIRKKRIFKK